MACGRKEPGDAPLEIPLVFIAIPCCGIAASFQFDPCPGAETGDIQTTHSDVDFVILTGGTDTALKIRKGRPHALLAAETGGKNATIVTAMADRDPAIKNVVHSAFGHQPTDPGKRGP